MYEVITAQNPKIKILVKILNFTNRETQFSSDIQYGFGYLTMPNYLATSNAKTEVSLRSQFEIWHQPSINEMKLCIDNKENMATLEIHTQNCIKHNKHLN